MKFYIETFLHCVDPKQYIKTNKCHKQCRALALPPIVLSFGGATRQRGQKPRTQNRRCARRRSGIHVIFPPKSSRHFSVLSRAPGLSGEGPLADAHHIAPLLPFDFPLCFRPPVLQGFRGVLVGLARRLRWAWHCHLRWRNLLSGYQPKALNMVRKAHHLCSRHFGSLSRGRNQRGLFVERVREREMCVERWGHGK